MTDLCCIGAGFRHPAFAPACAGLHACYNSPASRPRESRLLRYLLLDPPADLPPAARCGERSPAGDDGSDGHDEEGRKEVHEAGSADGVMWRACGPAPTAGKGGICGGAKGGADCGGGCGDCNGGCCGSGRSWIGGVAGGGDGGCNCGAADGN